MNGKLQYKDLDLKGLRERCDIDFAHYTYKKGQCSCCYGPKDLPKIYWRDRVISDKDYYEISYILFKNADNGSGCVKKNDYLSDKKTIYIEWHLNPLQLDNVCDELQMQVGSEFDVIKPSGTGTCIKLQRKDDESFTKIRR